MCVQVPGEQGPRQRADGRAALQAGPAVVPGAARVGAFPVRHRGWRHRHFKGEHGSPAIHRECAVQLLLLEQQAL